MTEQSTENTEQQPEAAKAPEQQPAEEGKGGKSAILADLSKERDRRQALETQMTALQKAQQAQTEALAKAFGLKEGEKPEADQLAAQVNTLQARIDAAERKSTILELASEHGIPKDYHHLLTASDNETLTAQATAVAELVKGRATTGPAPDPSQGAQPDSAEALAAAEYERFYPSKK